MNEVETYSDDQIAKWDADDQLSEEERKRIVDGLAAKREQENRSRTMNSRFVFARSVPVIFVSVLAVTSGAAPVHAQPASDFVPVTDAMLQGAGPRGLADVAPHHRRLGLQPPRRDRPRERRRPAHGVVAGAHPGVPVGHAARLPRGAVHAQPQRRHTGHRRGDRRPHLGAPARRARRRRRVPAGWPGDQQPQHRHLRPAHHRHQRRHPRLRPRRRVRRDGVGDAGPRLPRERGPAGRGADQSPAGRPSRAGAACRGASPRRAWSLPTTR